MIIKRADGASSAQIVTVFISRALVDILTLPNHVTDIALIITPSSFLWTTAQHGAPRNAMGWNTPAHFRFERNFSFNFGLTQPLTSRPIGAKSPRLFIPNEIPKKIRNLLTLLGCSYLREYAGTECTTENFGEIIKKIPNR